MYRQIEMSHSIHVLSIHIDAKSLKNWFLIGFSAKTLYCFDSESSHVRWRLCNLTSYLVRCAKFVTYILSKSRNHLSPISMFITLIPNAVSVRWCYDRDFWKNVKNLLKGTLLGMLIEIFDESRECQLQ